MSARPQRRAVTLSALALTLPVLVLGAGWLWASIRERGTLEREARALLERTAEVVRATVDESLEELRAREDARPFYVYNHFYSPPELVALSDPVAVSPLAQAPDDPRVEGWFQVDPGGLVRTPYEPDEKAPATERGRRVLAEVSSSGFAQLRGLARASDEALRRQRVVARSDSEKPSERRDVEYPALQSSTPDKLGQYTVSLNSWGNQLYEDIKSAQQKGELMGSLGTSRKAPVIQRRTVTPASTSSTPPPQVDEVAPEPRSPPSLPSTPTAVVDYTPMKLGRAGERLVLHRTVSHEGATSVQGVLLNERYLRDVWLPGLVARHAVSEVVPVVIRADDGRACELVRPVSDVLDGLSLCFPSARVEGALAVLDRRLHLQAALLLTLMLIAGVAAGLISRAARRADELSRQKSAFVSAVSHELRTPLTTLRMHAEMLRDDLVGDDKRSRFYTHMATEAVRLSHLVENVLEISRLDEGRRPLSRSRGDLGAAVAEVLQGQLAFAESRGFTLEARLPDEPVQLAFDRQALEQMLINLVDNAIKYAAEAEERTVLVEVQPIAGGAVVRVLDRGPGFPEEERERVFERFYRVARPGKEHVVGTGLGLGLVRDLARAHGGDVRITDREGGGAVVELRLARTDA